MPKIKISADSTCDLSPQLLDKYNIAICAFTISLGDESFQDGITIKPKDIFDFVAKNKVLPKTSAINIEDYINHFKQWRNKGFEILHISFSSKMSSSYQNACIAAEEVGGVTVIDSQNLSTASGLIVLETADRVEKGLSCEQIKKEIDEITPKVEASFVVDTLSYLHKGGRCSSVAALGANLLKLKPCIEVQDGEMHVGKKYRGSLEVCLEAYVAERLKNRDDIRNDRIFVTHTYCSNQIVNKVIDLICKHKSDFKEIIETTAGCTITSHCGPNTLGILFIRK